MANRKRSKGGECCCPPAKPVRCEPTFSRSVGYYERDPCCHEHCRIYGVHDEPYLRPFDPKECARFRRSFIDKSLGFPLGYVLGTVPTKIGVPSVESIRFAGNLKAFATTYFTRRTDWTAALIDQVVAEGQLLFSDSEGMESPNANDYPEIYDDNEQAVTRHFMVNDIEFALELDAPFELYGVPNTMAHLRRIMTAYFKRHREAVFWTPNWYLLIWKDMGVWMVLDLNGRDRDTFKPNQDGGLPVLFAMRSLDNVIYLIKSESNLEKTDKFTLRDILVVRLATPGPNGRSQEREFGPRMSEYDVIASDYGYLKSNLHLTLNSKDALRNRSALPVAVATAIASKVDHPATWDMKTYDKIICYGANMCKNCWEPCTDLNKPMDLDSFPRQIRMGQFVAEVLLTPNVFEGWWKCVPMYKFNDFHLMLDKALDENDYVIFQINNQMYSLWKKGDFLYLMDPYRHHIVGRILEASEDPKSASVRIFGNMDRLLSVFHQVLLESNRSAIFHIHTLRIRNLTECPVGTAPMLLPPDQDMDVVSLNENIRFHENYDKCLEELGEISDFEEDLASDIEPIEEISTSEEPAGEEEGEEAGPAEGGEDDDEDD
ncbi:GH12317 [Drosophila grimshawi]|uniref:GH12317 n=1 Tax=Drosophila grimshawi TaxID=7222 RepID=B4K1C3_DROGR|nr:GH12317 [Drosophila grimshawi]